MSTYDSTNDTWNPAAYEFDARPADFEIGNNAPRVAVIRTSDRISYRKCRRRWGWSSHLRGNLGVKQNPAPLWMGTGFHFALEDFHGAQKWGSAAEAFQIYVEATKRAARRDVNRLPADIDELTTLATGMLSYYTDDWMRNRDPLKTYVFNGVPQLEVNFRVELPFDATAYGYDRVDYSGTLDRVIEDEHGQLWIVEYKSAKTIQTLHLDNDTQVSSYCWAGNLIYGRPITGVIYQQHRKELPHEPRLLSNGRLSQAKDQLITHRSLRRVMTNIYGSVEKAPTDYRDMLDYLVGQEDMDSDKFVRRDRARRNAHQCEAEGVKILLEVEEMLNPNLALYPNPDRTCQYMCPFNGACTSLDDGSDYQYELDILMQPRDKEYDRWRKYLPQAKDDWMDVLTPSVTLNLKD